MRRPLLPCALALLTLAACNTPSDSTDDSEIVGADPTLGERPEQGEAALVKKIAEAATTQLRDAQTASGDRIARRDAHPKAHGCVTGSFTVDANIPADLAVGTFTAGKQYDAWTRYSNGSKTDDRENDARGMAIKLLNVDGQRLLANEDPGTHTHDLVLTNHHTFFVRNLTDYVKFMETVVEKGNPITFFLSINPFEMHLREAWLAYQFTTQPISNPLTAQYYSATPYALGNKAVKYKAEPCSGADLSGDHSDDPNYLAAAMKDQLARGEACFTFKVQRQTNATDMPVEDPTITWDESEAPFVPVAKLIVKQQTFDSPEQAKFCENLSFTPWHATQPHRPLGSTNRARKVVYEATSTVRHQLNNAARVEPTDLTVR